MEYIENKIYLAMGINGKELIVMLKKCNVLKVCSNCISDGLEPVKSGYQRFAMCLTNKVKIINCRKCRILRKANEEEAATFILEAMTYENI